MYYQINGGKKLFGEVTIGGAKNCLLPLLAVSTAIGGKVVLHDCPPMMDVLNMVALLKKLGAKVCYQDNVATIDAKDLAYFKVDRQLGGKLRGSVLFLGALLGRFKRATVPIRGGCAIGKRPIDIHISAFKKLGVEVEEGDFEVVCNAENAKGGNVCLPYPSVGATENLLSFAVLTKGRTILENVAIEPEVIALERFLVQAGAKIQGIGTNKLIVDGVKTLNSVEFRPIPDRIETATYMVACCMAQGKITLHNVCPPHVECLTKILKGATVDFSKNNLSVECHQKIKGFQVETAPYPRFATDMQSLALSLSTVAKGQSKVVEKVFENRFFNCGELAKMGAKITLSGDFATILGVDRLQGATVKCKDLRSGAGLVLAGLNAVGTTKVLDVFHVERGYCNLVKNLNLLGGEIVEIDD